MRVRKLLLIASVALNLVLLGGFGYVLHKKGGVRYLLKIRSILKEDGVTIESFSTYYQQKYSEFWGEPIRPGAVVFAGDSITEQHDWTGVCGTGSTLNRGIGADTSVGLKFRMGEIVRHQPSRIFLLIGIADLRIGRSLPRIAAAYGEILAYLHEKSPTTRVFVQSILPINPALFGSEINPRDVAELNRTLHELAKAQGAIFIDHGATLGPQGFLGEAYSSDGVHLNKEGYAILRRTIEQSGCGS